jgi:hypothetical protein
MRPVSWPDARATDARACPGCGLRSTGGFLTRSLIGKSPENLPVKLVNRALARADHPADVTGQLMWQDVASEGGG